MEYLVTMTTHVPDGTSENAVSDVRAREADRSRELPAQGPLLRLWRPPLQPGEWRSLGLFAAADHGQLEKVLASMPLRVWRTDEVTPLSPHRNDPGPGRDLQETGAEYLRSRPKARPHWQHGQGNDPADPTQADPGTSRAGSRRPNPAASPIAAAPRGASSAPLAQKANEATLHPPQRPI